jgi:hypothetical protein
MDILGHSQIALTTNTYGHVIPAMQQEAAGHMDVRSWPPGWSRLSRGSRILKPG